MYPDSSYLVVSADMPRRFSSPGGMFSNAQRLGVYMMVQGLSVQGQPSHWSLGRALGDPLLTSQHVGGGVELNLDSDCSML